jgi:hypothetical protein
MITALSLRARFLKSPTFSERAMRSKSVLAGVVAAGSLLKLSGPQSVGWLVLGAVALMLEAIFLIALLISTDRRLQLRGKDRIGRPLSFTLEFPRRKPRP